MDSKRLFLLALVAILCRLPRAPACPAGCHCDVTVVNCSSRGLVSVPANIPSNTTVLYLDHNLLTSIDGNDLSYLRALVEIDLSHNHISDILSGAFTNLEKLQILYLNHNNLTSLPAAIFDDVIALTKAVFAYNSLSQLPEGIFANNIDLVSLDLSYNRLNEEAFDKIKDLFLLGQLDLSGNPITLLPYLMLQNCEKLDTLVLKETDIDFIDPNSLLGMDSLNFLHLQNNKISNLKREIFQPVTSHIATLDVTGNPLVCDCDTTKFQDWLTESGVFFQPVTCYDASQNANVDIATGDLSHLCTDLDMPLSTPPPTCAPEPETCLGSAMFILLATGVTETSVLLSWQHSDVTPDAILEMSCRIFTKVIDFETNIDISTYSFTLSGLNKGTFYSCCAVVQTCDLYACADFITLGQDECSHLEFIIALSVLIVLLIFAIATVILLLVLKLRQDHKDSVYQEDPGKVTPHWDTSQSSLVSINNNNRITMGSMDSHLSTDSNIGRPLPDPRIKRESLYEHIPDQVLTQSSLAKDALSISTVAMEPLPGVANHGFVGSDSSSSDISSGISNPAPNKSTPKYKQHTPKSPVKNKRFQAQTPEQNKTSRGKSISLPGPLSNGQYLTPIEQQAAKKPRRFVRDPALHSQHISTTQSEPDVSKKHSLPPTHARHSDPSQVTHHVVSPRCHSNSEGDSGYPGSISLSTTTPVSTDSTLNSGQMDASFDPVMPPYLPPKNTPPGSHDIDGVARCQIINEQDI